MSYFWDEGLPCFIFMWLVSQVFWIKECNKRVEEVASVIRISSKSGYKQRDKDYEQETDTIGMIASLLLLLARWIKQRDG